MSYVDDFIKAGNELRARQEAAVQRQREWDNSSGKWRIVCTALFVFGGTLAILYRILRWLHWLL